MKKLWLGVVLLGGMLALGLWSSYSMSEFHEPLSQDLDRAAQIALAGDLSAGAAVAQDVRSAWQKHWPSTALYADHTPMDKIDAHFAQLEAYANTGNTAEFAACCSHIAALVSATAEAHRLSWRNLI